MQRSYLARFMRALDRMSSTTIAAVLCICCLPAFAQTWDAAPPAPWRRSDTTLIQLCFDRLDSGAPKRLPLQSIGENSMSGGLGVDLVGLTLTERPIYQGAIEHPVKYRSALVRLPNSEVWLRVDRPTDLEKNIDIWRDVPISMCTADPQANYKILSGASASIQTVACPEVGVHVRLKVSSYTEQALQLVHLKSNGPVSYNNLRGCRESVHAPAK